MANYLISEIFATCRKRIGLKIYHDI